MFSFERFTLDWTRVISKSSSNTRNSHSFIFPVRPTNYSLRMKMKMTNKCVENNLYSGAIPPAHISVQEYLLKLCPQKIVAHRKFMKSFVKKFCRK